MAGKTKSTPVAAVDDEFLRVESEDVIETEAEAPKLTDVRPDFHTMDEKGIKDYEKQLTKWLRDKGAVVRPMVVTEEVVDGVPATDENRVVSEAKEPKAAKKQAKVDEAGPKTTTGPVSAVSAVGDPPVEEVPEHVEGKTKVYEAVYEWEFDPKVPQRHVGVSQDRLQAIRNCIDESFHNRWNV